MRFLRFTLLSLVLAGGLRSAVAQTEVSVPDGTKFIVNLDLSAFGDTRLGEKVIAMTEQLAQQEIGEGEEVMEKVVETLGFNPLEEVKSLTVMGFDYEQPEKDVRLMLKLGKTTGNLEGLALGLPNYESKEIGKYTLHSAHEDDMAGFATIHTSDAGDKTVVASSSMESVMEMVGTLEAESSKSSGAKISRKQASISWTVPEGTFLQVHVLDFPKEVMSGGPQTNIAKLLQDVSITLGEEGDHFEATMSLTASTEKKAQQIGQLVQGAKAMLTLFEDEFSKDEEAKMAFSILSGLEIQQDGASIVVHGEVPEDMVMDMLEEQADIQL